MTDGMNILFFCHYFPPEVNAPASRTHEHCREWVKAGHNVTVVTCAPNHPFGRIYPGYRNRLWQEEMIDGIRVVRIWTYLAANEGFLRRSANYLSYMAAATLATLFLPKPHVVLSTSPQFFCGLAGYAASRIKRVPWVLEVRDLWPASIVAVGAMRGGPMIRLLERLEAWAYRKADRIIPVTDSFRPHIEARGAAAEKIVVVKNGVDLARFGRPEVDRELARELGVEGKFVAAYFGTHGMAHGLDAILQAAALLRDEAGIAFLMVGDGADCARLRALKERFGLANVIMLGQQPKDRLPALWGLADAALVLLRKSELFKTVIPSKLFEAMGASRPIVLGIEGEARAIVERAGCGVAIEPENAEQLAAAVRWLADHPELARSMGSKGHACVAREYDRKVLAARLEGVLTGLLPHPLALRPAEPRPGA
jgi:glycosyltransferase involved in cell wall biosynthesis